MSDGRLMSLAARYRRTIAHAVDDSRTSAFVRRLAVASAQTPLEQRIGAAAVTIAVASVTHSLLLLFVERYHYPRRTALILPALVGVLALLVTVYRDAVARGFTHRRRR